MANKYLPIGISLTGRNCLVVGGGKVALRKIDTLLEYDTKITVITPEPVEKIRRYAESNKLTLIQREYQSAEAADYGLVVSASPDHAVNKQVYQDATGARVPVNVVNNSALCDFVFPEVIRRDCLTVAVSTDGKAPFLTGYLRLILDDIFPERWNRIARYAAVYRKMMQERGPKGREDKMRCLNRFLGADWKEILKEKSEDQINEEMSDWLKGEKD